MHSYAYGFAGVFCVTVGAAIIAIFGGSTPDEESSTGRQLLATVASVSCIVVGLIFGAASLLSRATARALEQSRYAQMMKDFEDLC